MLKNTVTGSFLSKLFPTTAKYFLENAPQEEVNKAEQEAAVIHQQLNGLGESTPSEAAAAAPTETSVAAAAASTTPTTPVVKDQNVKAATVNMTEQLTAMTTRATAAEEKVTDLTTKLTAAEQARDQYKAWYDKQAGKGTALPGADVTNRDATTDGPTLSPASAQALQLFRQRQGKA